MSDVKPTVGLFAHIVTSYGYTKVVVQVMTRDDGKNYPGNPTSGWDSTGLDGLRMEVGISSYYGTAHTPEVFYGDLYQVNLRKAETMVLWLKNVAKKIAQAQAVEPGDVFMAFAKAVGARWSCRVRNGETLSHTYSNNTWRWDTIPEGREHIRELIAEACAEQVRKGLGKDKAAA